MRVRRLLVGGVSFALALFGAVFAQSGGSPFSLTVSAATATIREGGELRVQVTMKNITNHDIGIALPRGDDSAEDSYEIEVLDEKGEPAPDTAFSRDRKDPGDARHPRVRVGSTVIDTLKPGAELKDEAVITKLYDLTMAGKYVVRFSRRIEEEQGGGTVKSNAITITVVP
jgi:hypothetical protein